jgi:hypothetical protein
MADFVRLNIWETFHNEYKMAVGRRLGRKICLALCRDELSELTENETERVRAVAAYLQPDYLHGQMEIFWYILRGIHFPCDYDDIFAWAILHNATTKCSWRNNSVTLGKRY